MRSNRFQTGSLELVVNAARVVIPALFSMAVYVSVSIVIVVLSIMNGVTKTGMMFVVLVVLTPIVFAVLLLTAVIVYMRIDFTVPVKKSENGKKVPVFVNERHEYDI